MQMLFGRRVGWIDGETTPLGIKFEGEASESKVFARMTVLR